MLQSARAAIFRSISARGFYGWTVLAVSGLLMFGTGPGQSHLIGLFFDPLQAELGLSRQQLATAYGAATLVAALLLPQMGKLVDRHGPANMLWLIAFGLGLAAIGFSFATGWIYLAIGFGCLRFLGQGSLMLNCANLTAQWFDRKRGFALGLMALGFPVSIAVHPPLTEWLIATVGWREAWIWLGLMTWGLLIPPALLFLYNRPEEVGLRADGDAAPKDDAPPPPLVGYTRAEALRMPAFYLIVAGLFSLSMLATALHVEFKSILKAHGLDSQTAAQMYTITGVTAAAFMAVVGRMLDRLPPKWMFFGGLWVMTAALVSITLVEGVFSAAVFAAIFGVNNAVNMTYVSYFWPRYFGRKHLGSIQGIGQMIMIIGASLGPFPLAYAVDEWGGYDQMLLLCALAPAAVSVLVAFILPAPRLPEPDAAKG